ncbi:hypothetical protein CYMTET_35888 [Cymbomonas tetramitiformis]|uniref:Uncharacterized protein n=1 Tax=Cymbomonas tetramitiformis TaxID=36881 RepID=A0AAE0KNN2_9CHLO|nr:hypothetical protein CYMTET_35888 [Cymbomonas tetramitiformis]
MRWWQALVGGLKNGGNIVVSECVMEGLSQIQADYLRAFTALDLGMVKMKRCSIDVHAMRVRPQMSQRTLRRNARSADVNVPAQCARELSAGMPGRRM